MAKKNEATAQAGMEFPGDASEATAMTEQAGHDDVAKVALPAVPQPNPFEDVGREGQRNIVGQLLKFSKGAYVAGQDNIELPMGTRFLCNTDHMLRGWIRWENNKPAEQIMGLISEGFVPPKRDSLGFGYKPGDNEDTCDKSEWEVDEQSGQSRDPWQVAYYVLLHELDGEGKPLAADGIYTFTTQSKGGIDAVRGFCAAIGKWYRLKPDEYPIITAGYDQYEHPNPRFGWIKTPQFIRGYTSAQQMRTGKPLVLFNGQTDWLPKSAFGDIGAAGSQEDIPF
jgi:hypothetical protein